MEEPRRKILIAEIGRAILLAAVLWTAGGVYYEQHQHISSLNGIIEIQDRRIAVGQEIIDFGERSTASLDESISIQREIIESQEEHIASLQSTVSRWEGIVEDLLAFVSE